jgi:hypothetical protein
MTQPAFDHDNPPPLDFERWAELSADLLARTRDDQLDILEAREIELDLWEACNAFWVGELAAQIARSNLKLAERYGTRCAAALERRKAEPATQRATSPDATAFLTALPDDTAIPFKRQSLPPARPAPHPVSPRDPGCGVSPRDPGCGVSPRDPGAGDTLESTAIHEAPDATPFARG